MVPQKANKQTHRHTNTHMDKLTYSIGPEGQCFENVFKNSVIKKLTFKIENNKFILKKNV